MKEKIKEPVVLLAGGLGTRLREGTESRPKPMIEIGGRPVLWHLMKYFANFGHTEFIICAGYKSEVIADFLLNYRTYNEDFKVSLGTDQFITFPRESEKDNWTVTLAHTGDSTVGTGGRILNVRELIGERRFICTYGDGLSDLNLEELIKSHDKSGLTATLTAIHPVSRYGIIELGEKNRVLSFQEKPKVEGWVNGGFFVFEPKIFEYLYPKCVLEHTPLMSVAKAGQLNAFLHEGFWQSMDTFREYEILNKMWSESNPPWKIW